MPIRQTQWNVHQDVKELGHDFNVVTSTIRNTP